MGAAHRPPLLRSETMSKDNPTPKERYDARTAVRVGLKLNKGTDSDILLRLKEVPSMQGYIKDLIRADKAKNKPE